MGVYEKSADAIKALNLDDSSSLKIDDVARQRYLLMDWGYSVSFSGSGSHPVGLLGTVSFGVDAKRNSVFAVLHRFDGNQGAHEVIEASIASWRLPRHVAYDGHDVNLRPRTWLLAEADGSLALKLAASLGWNINFAKDAKLLGVTHNLSAKIDASLTASFGFSVSGKYIVVVGRPSTDSMVRLQLWKQSSKGLNFGFNLNVGVQGADPQLPANFDDFIKSTFGVHGLQVLNDLREWTDPSTDLGQKLAGLADQTALDLLKSTTGIDPAAEFDKAKQIVADALNTWSTLPDKLSSMLWTFLDKQAGQAGAVEDFKTFLADLANPTTGADALSKALQKATFGDTPQGQFLEAIADKGLLALANDLAPVSSLAGKVLDILNGGIIAKLQAFINQELDLEQIRKAVNDADFTKIEQWLQNRLGNFLDKTLKLDDLKDIQKAIQTLDTKIGGYYKTAVQALTKQYSLDFAAISTGIDFDGTTIRQFNTDRDVFWDWPDVDLRRAVGCDSHSIATLGGRLSGIQNQLLEAASGNASFFAPSMAGRFVELALNATGDGLFSSLLFTEGQLIRGATDALKQISAGLVTAAAAPTEAIKTLAKFAADLTDTFGKRVSSVYSGISGRVVGPMLLVESSGAVGSLGAKPAAILSLYALKPEHTFKLGDFIDGKMPRQTDVAQTQTLVSLS